MAESVSNDAIVTSVVVFLLAWEGEGDARRQCLGDAGVRAAAELGRLPEHNHDDAELG